MNYKEALEAISKIQTDGCVKDSRCPEFFKIKNGVYACCNQCVSYATQIAESSLQTPQPKTFTLDEIKDIICDEYYLTTNFTKKLLLQLVDRFIKESEKN